MGAFFSHDVYRYLIEPTKAYPYWKYAGSGFLAVLIPSGVVAGGIISMSIPNNWYLVYKILLGMGIQIIFASLKDLFTDRQRQRELKEIKSQMEQMEINHDRKIGQLKSRMTFMQADMEYYHPPNYQPMDLPSPKSN